MHLPSPHEFTERQRDESSGAAPLYPVHAVDYRLGFYEVDGEAPCEVGGQEGAEDLAFGVWAVLGAGE